MKPSDKSTGVWDTLHQQIPAPNKPECQDHTWAGPIENGATLLIVADGLGSASNSAHGSEAAVSIARRIVAEAWSALDDPSFTADRLQRWMVTIAAEWEVWSAESGLPRETLATTLAFCLCSEPYLGIASVGDSFACVLTSDDDCVLVDHVPREAGGASNVSSLSSHSAGTARSIVIWDPEIDAIFLSTDGLEGLIKVDRLRMAGTQEPQRVPSADKVIGGMLRRFQETRDANYVLANIERHQSLKGDDIGVAVAVRFSG